MVSFSISSHTLPSFHDLKKTAKEIVKKAAELKTTTLKRVEKTAKKVIDKTKATIKKGKEALKSAKKPAATLEEATNSALKAAKTKEAYLQILAQKAVYVDYKEGHKLASSDHFHHAEYQVKKTIRYPEGIKAHVITQENGNDPALLVFRGTDVWNISNLLDDINPEIGKRNCEKYKDEFKTNLKKLSESYGRVHVIGHSYGGTVAQRLTSMFPEYIARCDSHNAPGVGEKGVKQFKKNVKKLPKELSRPEVASYRHAKDLASLLGGKHLPSDAGKNYTFGSTNDSISHRDAHSFNTLSANVTVSQDVEPDRSIQTTSAIIEALRKGLGFCFASK